MSMTATRMMTITPANAWNAGEKLPVVSCTNPAIEVQRIHWGRRRRRGNEFGCDFCVRFLPPAGEARKGAPKARRYALIDRRVNCLR